ncbi:hypothetical protein PHISCL_06750 [Aspergillus sclerotialis]|uniref:Uncharacterized protein n=1 Tax=Aspergillus sclerotialis TaxID=2070753 RepID=A0A3A2ZNH1_9EURO|nr:hypothetical protein PHISCL_06750 [Aspergillus sclerotialis]
MASKQQNPHLSKSQSGTSNQTSNISASPSSSKQPLPLPLKQTQETEYNPANDPPGPVESRSASKIPTTEFNANEEGNNPAEVEGPRILFGDTAPQPRWVCVDANSLPDASQIMALRDVSNTERMVQPSVLPASVEPHDSALVRRPPGRMGVLAWSFDAGNEQEWNGLGYDMLYQHAYRVLEQTLSDPMARERLRDEIRQSNLAETVLNVDDPLPPLPPPPTGYDGNPLPGNIQPEYFYTDYERPTLARHHGVAAEPDESGIVPRMRRHIREIDTNNAGTTSEPSVTSREMTPYPETPGQGFSETVQAPTTGGSVGGTTPEIGHQNNKTPSGQLGATGQSSEHPSSGAMQYESTEVNEMGPSGGSEQGGHGQQLLSAQIPAAPSQPPISSNPGTGTLATKQPGGDASGETESQNTNVGGPSTAPHPTTKTASTPLKRSTEPRRNPPRKARYTGSYRV